MILPFYCFYFIELIRSIDNFNSISTTQRLLFDNHHFLDSSERFRFIAIV